MNTARGRTPRQLKLGMFLHPGGHHVAGWLHPESWNEGGLSFPRYVQLAQTAERGLAFLRAAQLYRRAIELEVEQPRWELERSLGEALLSAGRGAEAAAAFASAVHHAPVAARTALRRLAAEHFLKSGGESEGLRLLREALSDVKLGYPETTAAAIVSLLAHRGRLLLRGLRFEPRASVEARELERIDVAFAAGFGSVAAFYQALTVCGAPTPKEFRARHRGVIDRQTAASWRRSRTASGHTGGKEDNP